MGSGIRGGMKFGVFFFYRTCMECCLEMNLAQNCVVYRGLLEGEPGTVLQGVDRCTRNKTVET